jgi:hypothetical protein
MYAHELLRDLLDHVLRQGLVILEDLMQLSLRKLRDDTEVGLCLERVCFMMNFMAVIWPVHFRRPLYTLPNEPSRG